MKNKNLIFFLSLITVVLVVLIIFSGCNGNKDNKNIYKTHGIQNSGNGDMQTDLKNNGNISLPVILNNMTFINDGAYNITAKMSDGKNKPDIIILYSDMKRDITVPLCNKPNCYHNSDDCSAFISNGGDMNSLYIFHYNNSLFLLDNKNTIYSYNYDGSNKTNYYRIDGKYKFEQAYLLGDILYLNGRYNIQTDEEDANNYNNNYRFDLIKINLKDKDTEIVYSSKKPGQHILIGFFNNNAIIKSIDYEKPLSEYNQKALDKQMNERRVNIFQVDLNHYSVTELLITDSYNVDPVTYYDGMLYYHSRKESAIYSYNLKNKEIKKLAGEIQGYVSFIEPVSIIDNKLLFIKNHKLTNAYANPEPVNETFFIDLKTNKTDKLNLTLNHYGHIKPLDELPRVDGDKYIIILEINLTVKVGVISKDDFWANNFDNMEIREEVPR